MSVSCWFSCASRSWTPSKEGKKGNGGVGRGSGTLERRIWVLVPCSKHKVRCVGGDAKEVGDSRE